jgi:hypothetical protein
MLKLGLVITSLLALSALDAYAHDDDPNTKSCHSDCVGAPPARSKHKHPDGDCKKREACITASLQVPGQPVAAAKSSTAPRPAGKQPDQLMLAKKDR